jgi:hypothetical protein
MSPDAGPNLGCTHLRKGFCVFGTGGISVIRINHLIAFGAMVASAIAGRCGSRSGASVDLTGTAANPATCIAREISRIPLAIDGSGELYLEPTVMLPSSRGILLAGRPNYLFSAGTPGSDRDVVQDSVFGALLDGQGRARLVPAPIPAPLVAATRGIVLDDGRWALVFAELTSPWAPPKPDTIARIWYAEFDGSVWSRLEQLPTVPNVAIDLEMGSAVVKRGDTLATAAVTIASDGRGVVVFRRLSGRWTSELVDTQLSAAYAELMSDSSGLALAVVQPDRALQRDFNSLLLYGNGPRWTRVRSVVRGGAQPVYDPVFVSSPSGVVLSWYVNDRANPSARGRLARAMIGISAAADGRTVDLDSAVVHIAPVIGRSRIPMWVAESIVGGSDRTVRVLTEADGSARELLRFPSPFTGPFIAAAVSSSDVLISGPLFQPDSTRTRLVSLLIRVRVECIDGAP